MNTHIRSTLGKLDRDSLGFVARINIYGFGLLALWTAVDTLLLTERVADTVSQRFQGSALSIVNTLGVGLAFVAQPIAGRLSDAWPGSDRRRPFIKAGTILVLPGMLLFGLAPTFVFLICGFMLMQLATNISQAAYQAYIPDLIEDSQRGLASGVKNVLGVLGAAVGLLGAQGVLSLTGKVWPAMGVLAAIMVLVGWLTLRWVPAIPQESPKRNPSSIVHALNPRPMIADFARTLQAPLLDTCAVPVPPRNVSGATISAVVPSRSLRG